MSPSNLQDQDMSRASQGTPPKVLFIKLIYLCLGTLHVTLANIFNILHTSSTHWETQSVWYLNILWSRITCYLIFVHRLKEKWCGLHAMGDKWVNYLMMRVPPPNTDSAKFKNIRSSMGI